MLSWDIGPTWQLETDVENSSEVEIRFIAEGPDRTRVELEHRHLERHGHGWPSLRDGLDDDQGWPLYLACTRTSWSRPPDDCLGTIGQPPAGGIRTREGW